ncbi:acyl carrier protein [Actinoplanes sp. TBRC 11911]|uniref:acyl carrier protein n=1 Tax=Actinoplanes sp. TBRC 11911 TaxID=2729386 RepID=UPI00145E9659|nr:acyl carrier protein [Actinoplanes sp. TBRC 11911]NMO53351.1 acyl carrier protein [Actinoplanes sp. TBRC 11911]
MNALRTYVTERVAYYLERDAATIETDMSLPDHGLDSVLALALCGDIEDHLGVRLDPTAVWDYPTIDALLTYLSGAVAEAKP